MKKYITAGEFAKLASTTKRTIQYYDEKGVLQPASRGDSQYRYYLESQILDYQRILLLSNLGVTLSEMKQYVKKKGNLSKLFDEKKDLIETQIRMLQFNLKNLSTFQENLQENGTMIAPHIQTMKPFGVYYIEKIGSYAQIGAYCEELYNMFSERGTDFTTLAIFEEQGYRPKKSRMHVGALSTKGMKIKKEFQTVVQYREFDPEKVLTYTHNGSGSLLSLFWKELEKYARLQKIKTRPDVPDFEIYRKVHDDITKQYFEIYLPIE